MTFNHLNFDEISDLIDDELSLERKQYCKTHFERCNMCFKEYQLLNKCISLLSSLKNESIQVPDCSEHIIMIYRSRERRRLYMKAIPAIAASIIIVIGAGFIKAGYFNETGSYVNTTLTGHNETLRIIESIGKSNGRIIQITHSFIDSEFDKSDLTVIERILHSNKIKHAVIVNPDISPKSSSTNFEDVNYAFNNYISGLHQDFTENHEITSLQGTKIRIRIFR